MYFWFGCVCKYGGHWGGEGGDQGEDPPHHLQTPPPSLFLGLIYIYHGGEGHIYENICLGFCTSLDYPRRPDISGPRMPWQRIKKGEIERYIEIVDTSEGKTSKDRRWTSRGWSIMWWRREIQTQRGLKKQTKAENGC